MPSDVTLTEDDITEMNDLFAAFKLMQSLGINVRGITCLEEAKCRLLQYIKDKYGAGTKKHSNATELFQDVIRDDTSKRTQLAAMYQEAIEYIMSLPMQRRREIDKNIFHFESKLNENLESVRNSDCAILVAGEVSAGKSSLLNLLLGEELLPTSLLSCTSVMCELHHSESKYCLVYPRDSSKRPETIELGGADVAERLSSYIHQKGERNKKFPYERVQIYWPFPLLKGGVYIVDSPGVGESRDMTEMVKSYLPTAFSFIYVINSSNAGGLQPDRLQDLLATISHREDDLSLFDPRSAIFVCNKWDQVPPKEADLVKMDTMEKLKKCWPGVQEDQVFYLSTLKAMKSNQDSGYVTQDFARLLDGIEKLLPISLQCKLEKHYRWLSQVLRRSAFHLRVYIANETRSDEERKILTERLHEQLDKLESEHKRVAQSLKLALNRLAASACDQLTAHLASASTRRRLMHWEESECPDGDDWELLQEVLVAKVNKRIRREVNEWDTKNGIFTDIQLELLQQFQEEFSLMEDQLGIIEGGMVGRGGRPGDTISYMRPFSNRGYQTPMFSTTQKIVIGLAMPVLVPLGVVAGMFVLPVAGIRAIRARLQEMRLLNEYRQNKPETLAVMTDQILESFLERNNLSKLIQTQLQVVTKSLDRMIKSIPSIIEADRSMIDRLQQERVASEVSLAEKYIPYYQRCLELLGRLDYFYVANIRQYDASFADIVCDTSLPPIASGTFGDVYAARWRGGGADGVEKTCAVKIWREHVDEKNVSDILTEEDNLRKFDHKNIVEYYGTALRRSPDGATIQLVMIMELCDGTLRSRIVGPRSVSPGRLGHDLAQQRKAMCKVATYMSDIADALLYLHERLLVHRDLKPQNILLTKDDVIKLADVGLTKSERDISGTRCGSTCYAAPEVVEGTEYDKAADVFSLGVITWELWYGRLCHEDMEAGYKGDLESAIRSGKRPSLCAVHEPPEDWKTIIKACWAQNPRSRPTADYVLNFYRRLTNIDKE